ncbi:MAG TPA: hypothetical protein VGD67_26130 [Pseudonocardiaceae bacterium]
MGLAVSVPPAASANLADQCDQYGWWHFQDIGSNRMMGSCHYLTEGSRYWFATRTISTDFWRGYHGCVYAKLHAYDGTVLMTTGTQRYGVDAGRSRQDYWHVLTPEGTRWASFVHYRC